MKCPRCKTLLSSTENDDVRTETCPECEGEWLDAGELEKIAEHQAETFSPQEIAALAAVNHKIFKIQECEHDGLLCPHCETIELGHFNYSATNRIILDKCPECAGIWTDEDELEKADLLVDEWKKYLKRDAAKYVSILKKIDAREEQEMGESVSLLRLGFVNAILRSFFD